MLSNAPLILRTPCWRVEHAYPTSVRGWLVVVLERHVHFHVIARLPQWPPSLRGSEVFNGLGRKVERPLPGDVVTPLALKIRKFLLERLGDRVEHPTGAEAPPIV